MKFASIHKNKMAPNNTIILIKIHEKIAAKFIPENYIKKADAVLHQP